MSRTAVLADVHGNVPALRAVIADIDAQAVDEVLVGGDLVGRGPQGSRVVSMIRTRGWPSIRGNHEDYLLQFRRGEIPDSWQHDEAWGAARWMAAELSERDVETIDALPLHLASATIPGVRLVHGTPASNCDGIGPWTSERRLARHLAEIDEPVLLCAHTHRPLDRELPQGRIVNVGSVGLPFNRDTRAQYVVLDDTNGLEVEFRQVAYDLTAILDVYRSSGFLEAGGATAALLALEIEHAAPFLVPFFSWARAERRPPDPDQLDPFLQVYDPDRQREFFAAYRVERQPTGSSA